MNDAYQILGHAKHHTIMIIADHASDHVPGDIDLGLDPALLRTHIACDIGVAPVVHIMCEKFGYFAICGAASRLVVDLNREKDEKSAVPQESDGHIIPGNHLNIDGFKRRIDRFWTPYHEKTAALIKEYQPKLLLSLHSFTPRLSVDPNQARPWEIGILYNDDDRGARIAIPELSAMGLCVGDQLPYSGKQLNATMNRHGERNSIPYLGVEMRQDLVDDPHGQERFADILGKTCHLITETLAQNVI